MLYFDLIVIIRLDFIFRARFTFHTQASLLTFFCVFVLFRSCCSHARVFEKTLVHEFLISYSHTEWYFFSVRRNSSCFGRSFAYQNLIKLTRHSFYNFVRICMWVSLTICYFQRKSVSAEVNYGIRFSCQRDVQEFLRQLCQEVENRLTALELQGRCITLKLKVNNYLAQDMTVMMFTNGEPAYQEIIWRRVIETFFSIIRLQFS